MMMEALGNLSSERNSISLNQNKMFVKNQFPEVNKLGDFGGGLGKRNRGADLGLGKEVIDEEPQEGVISFEVDFIEKFESEIEQSSKKILKMDEEPRKKRNDKQVLENISPLSFSVGPWPGFVILGNGAVEGTGSFREQGHGPPGLEETAESEEIFQNRDGRVGQQLEQKELG